VWDEGTKVGGEEFKKILAEDVVECVSGWRARGVKGDVFFVHDGCGGFDPNILNRPNVFKKSLKLEDWFKNYMNEHDIKFAMHPSNSPDLNLCEYVWHTMKDILNSDGFRPETITQLRTLLPLVYELATGPDMYKSYVRRLYGNVQSCLQEGGNNHKCS
jgi:hypothetical protein